MRGEGAGAADFGANGAKSIVEFPNIPRPLPEVGSKVFAPSRVQMLQPESEPSKCAPAETEMAFQPVTPSSFATCVIMSFRSAWGMIQTECASSMCTNSKKNSLTHSLTHSLARSLEGELHALSEVFNFGFGYLEAFLRLS